MKELNIPEAAFHDGNSVEMARVWIAGRKLHCALKIGMYEESTDTAEEKAWGILLSDIARHVADAMAAEYLRDKTSTLETIKTSFLSEIERPTSATEGDFKK